VTPPKLSTGLDKTSVTRSVRARYFCSFPFDMYRGFKVGRYFYPPEIVYSTGRNYWTPQKLAVVKTTSTMVDWLVKYFS
jgi:hypothetical protein